MGGIGEKYHGVWNQEFIIDCAHANGEYQSNFKQHRVVEPLTSNFCEKDSEWRVLHYQSLSSKILNGTELWDKETHENLIFHKGSVMNNDKIPKFLKEIFCTVWEIPQKHCLDMASDRQRFIDQSQSMNIYLTNPSIDILTKIIFYGWKKQLKTGNYYVRTRALTSSQNFF